MTPSREEVLLPPDSAESITRLLEDTSSESRSSDAWNRIYALLYDDLRRIARSQIRKMRTGEMSPTSLVSETWLRLARTEVPVENRAHLVSLAARAMRFVLIDYARQRLTEKHGSGVEMLSLEAGIERADSDISLERLLTLDQALNDLADLDARLAKVVELRYFGGLSEAEIAAVTGVAERTVRRDWRKAQAFLAMRLGDSPNPMETASVDKLA